MKRIELAEEEVKYLGEFTKKGQKGLQSAMTEKPRPGKHPADFKKAKQSRG